MNTRIVNISTDNNPGDTLLHLSRAAIASRFGLLLAVDETPGFLREQRASFVTLTINAQLRGCIGTLQAYRPLAEDVRQNALAAAFFDPRFTPLSADEYNQIRLEVSLLSPLSELAFANEADALAQLIPGTDGVVFQCANCRGTFLPQVWETLPAPAQFLQQLKLKAGLPIEFWSEDVKLYRYRVQKWVEP